MRLGAAALTFAVSVSPLGAQVTTFNDATNDISINVSTGSGTLDIVKMEVVDTETDVIFTMTVNGNVNSANWGNFMVGIANQKAVGTTSGNAWGRPINLNAGATNGATNGMTHWIGSWVSGTGGGQLWTYGTNNWTGPAAPAGFAFAAGAQSTITYTVTKESLGVTNGDVIVFDAYSSGSGGSDSAVDALSNPTNSITNWSGSYTSSSTNTTGSVGSGPARSYTLANTALNTTQPITFEVDMRAQIGAGLFNPTTEGVDVEWGTGFLNFSSLTDGDGDGVYTGTPSVSAPAATPVTYRFVISPNDIALPLQPETVSRTFTMPNAPTPITSAFFNNIAGFRDVTFSVDMAAAQTAGAFNPATQTVQVRGPFNSWAGTTLTNTSGSLYAATIRMSAAADNQPMTYKYFVAETPQSQAIGYEGGAERTFPLAFNTDLNVLPALVLATDTFSTPEFRPVTFSVDMTVLEAAGGFTPGVDSVKVAGTFNNWDTGGTAYQLADEAPTNGVYTGTFIVAGATNSSISYKFFNTRTGAPNGGYENDPNRTATLGASGPTATQVLQTVYWNNDSGQTRNVTFRVDMSIQQALGIFDPSIGTVQLRSGSFGEGDARALTREGTTAVFSGTFSIPGEAGTTFQYKFWSPGLNFYNVPNNTGFEQINLVDQFQNRVITLEANGVAMTPPLVYFSNQLFYITGAPLNPFSTTQGSPSAPQSVTVNGQGLTADIAVAAPAGFEVSADGVSYGGFLNISPVNNAISAAPLYTRIAASAAVGSPAGNVALTSAGSQSVSIAVTGTVTAAANGYSSWLTNYPSLTGANTNGTADPDQDGFDNNLEFSFDGNPTTATAGLMTVRPAGTDAVFSWVQRNSGVAYEVQKNASLTNAWDAAQSLSISNSTNQGGILLPEDYVRREFIVPASGKDFYRVRSTITNN
jgi:hypothetical protein